MPFANRLRPLLTACLFLAALLPLRAANWQYITIDIAPGLRSHVLGNPAIDIGYSSQALIDLGTSSGGDPALRVSTLFDLDQPVTLFDFASFQSLSLGILAETSIDARRGQWTNDPSPPMLFFVLPWSLWGHEFALVHPNGGTYPVTKLPLSAGAGYGDGFEAWAICTPEQEF